MPAHGEPETSYRTLELNSTLLSSEGCQESERRRWSSLLCLYTQLVTAEDFLGDAL